MPRREAQEAAHTTLTNHRIIARPAEPWPKEAFEQTSADLPDLIHLNRLRKNVDNLPASTLLEAYREIAERKPEYVQAYQRLLEEEGRNEPNQASVQFGLGKRDLENGKAEQAAEHLRLAIKLDPRGARSYQLLSQALGNQGLAEEAIPASEKAVSLEPYEPLYQKTLISHLIDAKHYGEAVSAMERYLSEFPEDEFMRKMLEIARQ